MISFKVNERGFSFVELKRNKVMSKRTKWKYKKNGMEFNFILMCVCSFKGHKTKIKCSKYRVLVE